MPEAHVRYTYTVGQKGFDGLSAYVLVEHLRSLGVEFDEYATALDMTSLEFRLHMRIEEACAEALGATADIEWHDLAAVLLSALGRESPYRVGSFLYMGLCDRQRLLAYLDGLTGDDRKALGSFGLRKPEDHWTLPLKPGQHPFHAIVERRKPIVAAMVATLRERVAVTVVSAGRVIAMAQATGGDGAPLEVRRYKGGTDANGVRLGECMLHASGLIIIRRRTGLPAKEKVTEVTNELSGHVVKLTATEDTTPKGQEREVKTVAEDATLTLTGRDHRKSWIVTVEDAPET